MIRRIKKAFTLFEVMIALAILSIAMLAGIVTTNGVLDRAVYIEKKIFAHWIAMNTLNKIQLKMFKDGLQVSSNNGTDTVRGKNFSWKYDVTEEELSEGVYLLNLQVRVYEDQAEGLDNKFLDGVSRKIKLIK